MESNSVCNHASNEQLGLLRRKWPDLLIKSMITGRQILLTRSPICNRSSILQYPEDLRKDKKVVKGLNCRMINFRISVVKMYVHVL